MNYTMTVGEIRTAVIKLKSLRSNILLRTKSKIEMSKASLSSDKISWCKGLDFDFRRSCRVHLGRLGLCTVFTRKKCYSS